MACGRLLRCQARGMGLLLRGEALGSRRGTQKARPGRGRPGRAWSASRTGRLINYRQSLAVGAFEAAVEHPRAHLALVLALEQCPASALVAAGLARLFRRAVEDD